MTTDSLDAYPNNTLYHLNHLACIEVSGDDAGQFLQGQMTCNINDLSESKASIAAFCNPKGRAISTLLIIKTQNSFLLVLPASLLEKVLKKLQMYVLRSKVQLTNKSNAFSLIGHSNPSSRDKLALPSLDFHCTQRDGLIDIKLPSSKPRFLCIIQTESHTTPLLEGFALGDGAAWHYQDISSGFPWFDLNQSEKHIPQMLNLDNLGGISFNKGCYTGQEIIARTHYLGKAKRHLYLLECKRHIQWIPEQELAVLNAESKEKIGEILDLQELGNVTRLLAVLQTVDEEIKNFILDDSEHTPVVLTPFQ